jgi:hypothetical protein
VCDIATIAATLAITAAVANTVQQQQSANAENKYQELVYDQRHSAAIEEFAALQQRELQERSKAAQDIRQVTAQARQAQGAAKLQALESGTGGQSLNILLAQFERSQLTNVGIVQSNLADVSGQLHQQAVAAGHIEAPQKAFGPLNSPLGTLSAGLNAGAAGFNAYHAFDAPPAIPTTAGG